MLDSLFIKNFRLLEDLSVAHLGRLNLIVGKNNSGKSSVLEALRVYAACAQRSVLEAIAGERNERIRSSDEPTSEDDVPLPFQDFFSGRVFPEDDLCIEIGRSSADPGVVRVKRVYLVEFEETVTEPAGETTQRVRRRLASRSEVEGEGLDLFHPVSPALQVTKGTRTFLPILLDSSGRTRLGEPGLDASAVLPCAVVSTRPGSLDDLADDWDRIVFSEHEQTIREAMQIIEPDFEDLTFVKADSMATVIAGVRRPPNRALMRTPVVKLSNVSRPVPLNSLGDGMLRLLQILLKVYPAKGGLLLIDEFENGLHYSVQEKVWALLFDLAQRLDIQVFATTHSWDCIESFARVAHERKDVEGVLFRVGRSVRNSDRGKVVATVFDEEALYAITQSDVEVR